MMNKRPKSITRLQNALSGSSAYLLYVLIALIAVITAVNPRFFSAENFLAILRSGAYSGIFAIGFLFVLLSGGLDISFAAVATVGQYLVGLVLINMPWVPWPFVVLLPMLIGILLGCFNAALIHWLNAPPLIITIAMQSVLYGILQYASNGTWLYNFPDWFAKFPLILVVSFVNKDGVKYGLSILTVIWLAVAVCAAFILSKTKVGRRLYAMGGSSEAARRAGIDILRYRLFAYGFLGFTAGLGGLIHTFVTQTVAPNTLVGNEFNVVAAVVLGGASIFGGSGSVEGTLLGGILIAVITNALTIMRVPAYWHQVFIGAILIASMAITTASERRARKKDRIRHGE
ncbi:MAG: ABC transporter permease [Caldilineaceae bacterium]